MSEKINKTDGGSHTIDYMHVGPLQGWQCPICKHIWGPFTRGCDKCNCAKHEVVTTTTEWESAETSQTPPPDKES